MEVQERHSLLWPEFILTIVNYSYSSFNRWTMCKNLQSPNDKEIKIIKFIKLKHNEVSCGLLAAYIRLFPKQHYWYTNTFYTTMH